MTACLKCGHITTSSQQACPACGAIYAKVEAAMHARAAAPSPAHQLPSRVASDPAKSARIQIVAISLLGICALLLVSYYGYERYNVYKQRQADLAYCSKIELAAWEEKIKPGLEQFDRAAKAASVAPRIALAPLILRLSEARAEVKKLAPPPPCAAESLQLLQQAMELREDAFISFARQEGEFTVSSVFREAEAKSQAAFAKLAEARARSVE